MDSVELVEQQRQEGREIIEEMLAAGATVSIGMWVKPADAEYWELWIALEEYDRRGPGSAYQLVYDALMKKRRYWVTGSDIRVVGLSDPVVQSVMELARQQPTDRLPLAIDGRRIHQESIDRAYVYPRTIFAVGTDERMTSDEVVRSIVSELQRLGSAQSALVKTVNDESFRGVPVSMERTSDGLNVCFEDVQEHTRRVLPLTDIRSIR